MLPITRANIETFCRVCLRDIANETVQSKQSSAFNRMCLCSNCEVKLEALRQFRCKAIVATGALRVIVYEEMLKSTNETSTTLLKLKSICRICLKELKGESHSKREKNLVNEIFEYTGLLLDADEKLHLTAVLGEDSYFPDKICNKCHTIIKSYKEFWKISQQSAEYLANVSDESGIERCTEGENIAVQMSPIVATEFIDHAKLDRVASPIYFVTQSEDSNYSAERSDNENFNMKSEPDFNDELELTASFASYFPSSISQTTEFDDLNSERVLDEPDCLELQQTQKLEYKNSDSFSKKLRQRAPKTFRKAFKCELCNKNFYKKFMHEAHVKSVHESVEKPFSCLHCESTFRLVQVLHRHMISCHKNTEETRGKSPCHNCLRCQKTFKRKEHLKEHIRAVHDKLKPFKCRICEKAFGTQNTKMRHERNHSKDKPFSCEYCAKRYNSESELKVHIQRHISLPELLCPICKRAKPTTEELQKHIASHNCSYQCSTCGKVFKKLFHLREHENTVHLKLRSLKCSYCDLTFTIRKTLKNHERSHDAINLPEKCSLCDLNFKSKRALTLHTKKVHVKES